MPVEEDNKLKKSTQPHYKGGLRFKFIFWISIVLILTLGGAAIYDYQSRRDVLESNLRSKANAIGRFIALISPDAIHSYDVSRLDRFVQQITNDPDVSFAQIRSFEGNPITTYLPEDIDTENIDTWISQQHSSNARLMGSDIENLVLEFAIKDDDEILGWVLVGLVTSRIEQVTREAVLELIIIYSVIVLALGSIIFVIFKMQVLHPVNALSQGASRVADGNLDADVPIVSKDELGRLAKSFNEMMQELKIDRETLLGINTQLAKEIEYRQKVSEDLKKLSLAVEQSPASVLITDLDGVIEYVNPKFSEVSGYTSEEVIGKHSRILGADSKDSDLFDTMWQTISNGGVWKGEFCNKRKNGKLYWESAVIAPIRSDDGNITHYLAVKEDITERKAFEEKLLEQATHDQLTKLPNRFLAFDRLQQQLQHAKRNNQYVAVIYIDLDNFKNINDSMGHPIGDQLLIKVAKRIKEQLRTEDTLARLGGDEFLALIPDVVNPSTDLERVVTRLLAATELPIFLNNREVSITSSLGIAIYPGDGTDVSTLMSNADIAMYEAKRAGRNTFRFFTRDLNKKVTERIELESQLSHALEAGELYPVYQPIIDIENGALVGAEVLLRWDNPVLGSVPPSDFIPAAEQSGLIRPITEWLFQIILDHAESWEQRPNHFWLSVNVPPNYFSDVTFIKNVTRVAQQASRIDLKLCLEITENLLLRNDESVFENFHHLNRLGVESAMDDFGTGYSSLAYLKRFPLNHLKIDRSFINGLPDDLDNRTLTETIVLMGKKFGMSIIAEGVETLEQAKFLNSLYVDYAQGYYYSKPIPHQEFASYIADTQRKSLVN
ncbi:MAG: EAL domain-containing protein [Candidatus Thiodiazotropha sp. (ex Ctena orbiculata)]|nr:EAL domain-containing protein [Candidatus Thiodiazotropha taylori]MBT3002141.1 EAL domain-containing protein [Candidatus Thiodiazotropha taylori]MBV2112540.1 EAL domain-containing protein [Candidatus Thiodiazotropha taylori]